MTRESSNTRNVFKANSKDLRIGNFALIKGQPVKITNFRVTIPGKHGHKKSVMKGINLIDGTDIADTVSTNTKDDMYLFKPIIDSGEKYLVTDVKSKDGVVF